MATVLGILIAVMVGIVSTSFSFLESSKKTSMYVLLTENKLYGNSYKGSWENKYSIFRYYNGFSQVDRCWEWVLDLLPILNL